MTLRIGELLHIRSPDLLSQIADITRITYDALRSRWDHPSDMTPAFLGIPGCGRMPVVGRRDVSVRAPALADIAVAGLRELDLGTYRYVQDCAGPDTVIDLRAVIPPASPPSGGDPDARSRLEVAELLLPIWFRTVAPLGRITHRGFRRVNDLGEFGTWRGLFWRRDYPWRALGWSMSTLWHWAEVAADSESAAYCEFSADYLRGFIDGVVLDHMPGIRWAPTVQITDRDLDTCTNDGAKLDLTITGSNGLMVPSYTGVGDFGAQYDPRPPFGFSQDIAGRPVDLGATVTFCVKSTSWMAQTDYYFWWARRLLFYAQRCSSPWYAFMAILAARLALRYIIQAAGLLLHELLHGSAPRLGPEKGDHCTGRACCYDWAKEDFVARIVGILALPQQAGPQRFLDAWDERHAPYPDGSCGRRRFLGGADHCNVLRRNHFVQVTTTIGAACLPTSSAGLVPTVRVFGDVADCPPTCGTTTLQPGQV